MPAKQISQREARAMRKELRELHERDAGRERSWSSEYVGGVNIDCVNASHDKAAIAAVKTARLLGHFVIATVSNDETCILFYAVPARPRA